MSDASAPKTLIPHGYRLAVTVEASTVYASPTLSLGTVLAIGKDVDANLAGDRVLFPIGIGYTISYAGKDCVILSDADIVAILR